MAKANKQCEYSGCPFPDRTIPGERGQQPATRYHKKPCADLRKEEQTKESDKRPMLRELERMEKEQTKESDKRPMLRKLPKSGS